MLHCDWQDYRELLPLGYDLRGKPFAPPLAGYMRGVQGTYSMAFKLFAVLSFFVGILFLMARNPESSPAP